MIRRGDLGELVDLLFDPHHLGPRSPDWRVLFLRALLRATGATEGFLHAPWCRVMAATKVMRRESNGICQVRTETAGAAFPELPPSASVGSADGIGWYGCDGRPLAIHDAGDAAGPQDVAEGSKGPRAAFLTVDSVTGPLEIALTCPKKYEGSRPASGPCPLILAGRILQGWAAAFGPGSAAQELAADPLQAIEGFPHPALVLSDGASTLLGNSAAAEAGFLDPGGLHHTLLGKGLNVRKDQPWSPLESIEVDLGPIGSYRLFRMPMEDLGDGLFMLVLLPGTVSPPTHSRLQTALGLSPRESQVAMLLARGLSTKAIAKELEVSWHTARGHVTRVLKKIGVGSRREVMRKVMDMGLKP